MFIQCLCCLYELVDMFIWCSVMFTWLLCDSLYDLSLMCVICLHESYMMFMCFYMMLYDVLYVFIWCLYYLDGWYLMFSWFICIFPMRICCYMSCIWGVILCFYIMFSLSLYVMYVSCMFFLYYMILDDLYIMFTWVLYKFYITFLLFKMLIWCVYDVYVMFMWLLYVLCYDFIWCYMVIYDVYLTVIACYLMLIWFYIIVHDVIWCLWD